MTLATTQLIKRLNFIVDVTMSELPKDSKVSTHNESKEDIGDRMVEKVQSYKGCICVVIIASFNVFERCDKGLHSFSIT